MYAIGYDVNAVDAPGSRLRAQPGVTIFTLDNHGVTRGYQYASGIEGGASRAGSVCLMENGRTARELSTTRASSGVSDATRLGVATQPIPTGYFGWFQVFGECNIYVNGATPVGTVLYSTDTLGAVGNEVTTGKITGLVLTTAAVALGVSTGFISWANVTSVSEGGGSPSVTEVVRYYDDFGTVGDGLPNLLSETFPTLAAAQAQYPYATSLSQSRDFVALLEALYDAPAGADADGVVKVIMGPKKYYWSETFIPLRAIHLLGPGIYEGDHSCSVSVVAGVNIPGIRVNDNAGGGSCFEGFRLSPTTGSSGSVGGVIVDYSPASGLAVMRVSATLSAGVTYYMTNFRSATVSSLATFTVTPPANPHGTISGTTLAISGDPSDFTLGEVITGDGAGGGTVGATANVAFISPNYPIILLSNRVGDFDVGDHITGGTSLTGATITMDESQSSLTTYPVTVVTGAIGSFWDDPNVKQIFSRADQMSNGVEFQRRCYLRNMRVSGWSRHGVAILAGADGFTGNSNLSLLANCELSNNMGNGLIIVGADANVVTVKDCTYVNNAGAPVVDRSFLGCNFHGANHASVNYCGGFNSVDNSSRNSLWLGPYTESGFSNGAYEPTQETLIEGATMMLSGTHGLGVKAGGGIGGLFMNYNTYKSDWLYKTSGGPARFVGGDTGIYDPPCATFELGGNSGSGRGVAVEYWYPWSSRVNGVPFGHVAQLGVKTQIFDTDGGPDFRIYTRGPKGTYLEASGAPGSLFLAEVIIDDGTGEITDINVLAQGEDYPVVGTTITITNPGAGAGAVLHPIIMQGRITGVHIENGGTGYTRTFPLFFSMGVNNVRVKINSWATGVHPRLEFTGPDANHNAQIVPKGTGVVWFPIGNVPAYASDALAAAGGVPIGGVYRTASALMIRVT